ncbi:MULTISPECIES: M56 family metallopeptidase [unclassified Sphingomonas]|uniref:M56 family metallopeptidase n=1 Tax=unclassified Sphingomonas TaxID=196159 RepID=UPI002150A484|nr:MULTISPECIES: M56 family metallopeptidase [unclassified Sphingomonas]MCR5871999.1 M56 family metallopeptidase [Sphingomonas sp. J344]UUX99727.1 M56 family metallopeptidase [Sphingomonas sp. J315]
MIAWMVETCIATTLLMLLVLAIRKPVREQFGPNIAYALWLLPVLRLLIPPLPGAWSFTDLLRGLTGSVQSASADPATTQAIIDQALVQAQLELAGGTTATVTETTVVTSSAPSLLLIIGAIWAAGALAFLLWHIVSHTRFCANLMRKAEIRRTVAEGRVHVIETDAATGPLAFGIWRKYVAFPRDFAERYDPVERNLALAHELGHHLRGDLIANWVALVVLAIHWFNPVAWRAFRAFRADQELACDALVLSGRAPALRHAYGRAIVKSAHGGAVSAACHLHTVNELKGRLKMLSKHNPKSRARITAGVTGAIALTLTGLALTASGAGAAVTQADAPTPPAAPVAPAAPAAVAAIQAPDAPAAPEAPEATKEKRVHRIVMVERKDGKDKDGKGTKAETRVIRLKGDGKDFVWTGDMDIDVKSMKCGGSKDDEVKVETRDGDKRKIVICTDRIEMRAAAAADKAKGAEAIAARAKVMAIASADMGKRHALMGLKMARRSIEAQTELSAEQKANALKRASTTRCASWKGPTRTDREADHRAASPSLRDVSTRAGRVPLHAAGPFACAVFGVVPTTRNRHF